MAHPLTVNDYEELITALVPAGLGGIEAYYGEFSDEDVTKLVMLAQKLGLVATGGSDYHGLDENAETPLGGAEVPLESAEKLMALAGQKV